MDFLILNLYLCILCVPALLLLGLGQRWLMSSLASFFVLAMPEREPENKNMSVRVASVAASGLAFLYVAGAWSALCVATATTIVNRGAVTWDWPYLIVSFIWCALILLRSINLPTLYQRVTTETPAVWDQAGHTFHTTLFASFIICGLAALAWIVFAIWPGSMLIPYGWVLNPLARAMGGIDGLLKANWWIPLIVLSVAVVRLFTGRSGKVNPGWRVWGAELDRVVFITRSFAEDWAWYGKNEFLVKMPGTWAGATVEDKGAYVVVRNPDLYRYFEFHFMFGERQDAPMSALHVRGLKELQGLWLHGHAGELGFSLKPENGSTASPDAKKAAELMKRKFGLRLVEWSAHGLSSAVSEEDLATKFRRFGENLLGSLLDAESFQLQRNFKHAMAMAGSVDDLDERVRWCDRGFEIAGRLNPWPFQIPSRDFAVGSLHGMRGQAYLELRARDYGALTRLAVADLEAATGLITPEDGVHWGHLMNILSIAYCESVDGNPADNKERAIRAAEAALSVLDPLRERGIWVEAMVNLAGYHGGRLRGAPHENYAKALSILRRAQAAVSREYDEREWAMVTAALGGAYYRRGGDNGQDVEAAIDLIESALPILQREVSPHLWAGVMMNLSSCYKARIKGDYIRNTERAIHYIELASSVLTREQTPAEWAEVRMNLGAIYAQREDGDPTHNTERAIRAFEEALTVFTPDTFPVEHAQVMLNLSQARENLTSGSKKAHTESAVEAARASVASIARDAAPRVWALACLRLGNALRARRDGDRRRNIAEAITNFEKALDVLGPESDVELWSVAKSSLANALAEQTDGNPAENLERSIRHQQEALAVIDPVTAPEDWAAALRNLSISFGERPVGSRADNAERAVALAELGLVVLNPHDHPTLRSELLETLGGGFEHRIRGDRVDNLARAVQAYDDAWLTRNRGENPEAWLRLRQRRMSAATRLQDICATAQGAAALERFSAPLSRRFGAANDADPQAFLEELRDATSAISAEDHPRTWAAAQEGLARALVRVPTVKGGGLETLIAEEKKSAQEAIRIYEGILALNPKETQTRQWATTQRSLASAYLLLHMMEDLQHRGPGGLDDRARVELPNRSDEAMRYLELAAAAMREVLSVHTAEANAREHLTTAVELGSCQMWRRDWEGAAAAFASAGAAAERLLADVEASESEVRDALRALGDLSTQSPFVEVMNGRLSQSLDLLEVGRARLLAKALRLASLPLSDDERETLNRLSREISTQERLLNGPNLIDRTTPLDEAVRLRQQFREELAKLDSSVISPTVDAKQLLTEVTAEGAVVVVPLLTDVGGRILLGYSSGGQATLKVADADSVIALQHGIFERSVKEGWPGWLDAYREFSESKVKDLHRWNQVVEATAESLGELVAEPVLREMQAPELSCSRLDILPQGPLGLLPLNLARDPATGAPLIDRFEVSLSPSLTALAHVRSRSRRAAPPRTITFVRHSNGKGAGRLPNTPFETELVASWFDESAVSDGRDTSKEEALDSLRGRDIWHFACHGEFDLNVPLRSSLGPLKGEWLTLEELFDARGLGNPQLVVLSACSTGLYDARELPSEFIGLPNAFLQLGAAAVVATLWPVADVTTALLVGRFYEAYLGGKSSCGALRDAQLWLRGARTSDLRRAVETWVADGRLGAESAAGIEQELAYCDDPETPPFAQPVYWAGFVHFGA